MSEKATHCDKAKKFAVGMIVGAAGAAAFYLFGTKQGKKTRKILEKKGKDVLDEIQTKIDELEVKGKELTKQAEEAKKQIEAEIKGKKTELTEKASKELDKTLKKAEKIQEEGRKETAKLRKRIFKNVPKRKVAKKK